jgi:medium-chain acyl-[acyl-carrier-protein] hydrolase
MSPWFELLRPSPAARCRLFCFPYAGGGASVYRSWSRSLPAHVELIGVQLPGRERRFGETPFLSMQAAVDALYPELRRYLDRPFSFFGYSVGALLAYELACRQQANAGALPANLFVAACNAPHAPRARRVEVHRLPDSELIDELRALGGMSPLALQNPELLQLLMPVLRADLAMAETYEYRARAALPCRLGAFGGLQDEWTSVQAINGWRAVTTGPFTCTMLEGGHFFIHSHLDEVVSTVTASLARVTA